VVLDTVASFLEAFLRTTFHRLTVCWQADDAALAAAAAAAAGPPAAAQEMLLCRHLYRLCSIPDGHLGLEVRRALFFIPHHSTTASI